MHQTIPSAWHVLFVCNDHWSKTFGDTCTPGERLWLTGSFGSRRIPGQGERCQVTSLKSQGKSPAFLTSSLSPIVTPFKTHFSCACPFSLPLSHPCHPDPLIKVWLVVTGWLWGEANPSCGCRERQSMQAGEQAWQRLSHRCASCDLALLHRRTWSLDTPTRGAPRGSLRVLLERQE